ncbi:MAG: hypothetical protein EA370_05420 [Wenzhouxiangella sp.]|nr:MAG: hypothetical protein EA370_05420 [Wenzhouxiangella sp.]
MPISAEFNLGKPVGGARRLDQSSIKLVLMGNWLGDRKDPRPLGQRSMPRIDIDQFEQVLAGLAPQVDLAHGETLSFSELDDFHPDALCRRLPALAELLAVYRDLNDPARAPELIKRLAGAGVADSGARRSAEPAAAEPETDLERLLGGRVADHEADKQRGALQQFLGDVVAPHLVDAEAARPFRQAVAAELGERVNALLALPAFKSLEGRWRGLWWLISQVIGTEVELRLLQVTDTELAADLDAAGAELGQSGLFGQLFADQAQARGQILVWVDAQVGSDDDLRHLAALSTLAGIAGGSLLAGADPTLCGAATASGLAESSALQALEEPLASRWHSLRSSSVAPHAALVVPRLLARAPFGAASDAIDSFPFEEAAVSGERLCWMSGAFGLAAALGQAFLEYELDMDPGAGRRLEDLPSFSRHENGEQVFQPPVEVVLSESAIDAMARRGFSTLMGSRSRIEVLVPGCLSITGSRLAGPWES